MFTTSTDPEKRREKNLSASEDRHRIGFHYVAGKPVAAKDQERPRWERDPQKRKPKRKTKKPRGKHALEN